MKKTASYWLLGCGIGCGLIVLVIVGLMASGAFFVRGMVKEFDQVKESQKALEERFGPAQDFTPWPDGAIPAERMEAFLGVREASAEARAQLAENLAVLPTNQDEAKDIENKPPFEKIGSIFDITRASFGFASSIGALLQSRNQALLETGMGMGEYAYIYVLSYYATGNHPVDDSLQGLPMPNTAARRVADELRQSLQHQLEALPEDAAADWRARLEAEVALLEEDHGRLPWKEDVPAAIETSIAPYRERLEAQYEPAANPFELGREGSSSSFSIQMD